MKCINCEHCKKYDGPSSSFPSIFKDDVYYCEIPINSYTNHMQGWGTIKIEYRLIYNIEKECGLND